MIRQYIPLLLFVGFIASSGFLLYAIWSYMNDDVASGKSKKESIGPIREPSVDWDRSEGPTILVSDGREFLLSPADQELLKTGATTPAEFEKQYFTNERAFK
jgi:hypothetical protein